jgi:hypothetical protein
MILLGIIMLTDGLAEISKGNVSRNEMRVAKKGKSLIKI